MRLACGKFGHLPTRTARNRTPLLRRGPWDVISVCGMNVRASSEPMYFHPAAGRVNISGKSSCEMLYRCSRWFSLCMSSSWTPASCGVLRDCLHSGVCECEAPGPARNKYIRTSIDGGIRDYISVQVRVATCSWPYLFLCNEYTDLQHYCVEESFTIH
jgi:hypothetical protein